MLTEHYKGVMCTSACTASIWFTYFQFCEFISSIMTTDTDGTRIFTHTNRKGLDARKDADEINSWTYCSEFLEESDTLTAAVGMRREVEETMVTF